MILKIKLDTSLLSRDWFILFKNKISSIYTDEDYKTKLSQFILEHADGSSRRYLDVIVYNVVLVLHLVHSQIIHISL